MGTEPMKQPSEAPSVHLRAERLGDPTYERGDAINNSVLKFYGESADYVAEVLDAARSKRVINGLVREYATLHAHPTMPAVELSKILHEFALRLLDSCASASGRGL